MRQVYRLFSGHIANTDNLYALVKLVWLTFVGFAVFWVTLPLDAAADPQAYGSGAYDNCSYTGQCAPVVQPVTMPDGVKASINLTDGQTIPDSGYTIIITQLSGGSGATIKSASILINGSQVQTVEPDSSGTIRWKWDPHTYPGTHIGIVVTATDGTIATYNYTIKLASAVTPPLNSQFSSGNRTKGFNLADVGTQAIEVLRQIVPENVKQVFRSLPQSTINTFPYAFFTVLGLVAIADLLLIKRELSASHRITRAIEKEKLMIELKRNFVGLASHYLRTPITIITGAVDLMESQNALPSTTLSEFKMATGGMLRHVESMIVSQKEYTERLIPPDEHTRNGVRIGVGVAILGMAFAAALFNLLAYVSGRVLPGVNLMTQLTTFVLVGLALYQIDRRLVLRRNERRVQNNVLMLQQELQIGQDDFVEKTSTELYADYLAIYDMASKLPDDAGRKMIEEGLNRYRDIIARCKTVQTLKGSRSQQQPVLTDLRDIFAHNDQELSEAINAKGISFSEPQGTQISVREPNLLKYVTHSLIDNAVAYSPEHSTITLGAHSSGSKLELTVADNGKGISKEQQQLLFQPLSKIEGYEKFDHAGMGFSLYLDRVIMQYLNGDITIESAENQGTTVNVQLPVGA